jgi:uncharacterized protein YjbJ (UPF0337 family)
MQGKAQEALGKGKVSLGKLLDNEELEDEGRADQVKGKLKQAKGAIKDTLEDVGDRLGQIGKKHDS